MCLAAAGEGGNGTTLFLFVFGQETVQSVHTGADTKHKLSRADTRRIDTA